ncbi:hypothetical protein B2I21_28015 [Chryseobacterium mucoviscidosis]|nr:hypothetical protein B2I21_28015 [Chryseobacterium mucoviscidosis]
MGKIVYFPSTYLDEDFRSIVHRYNLQSAKTFELSKKELLGKSVPNRIIYPQNLESILSDLGLSNDFAEHIILKHSFFPFISPFLSRKKQEGVWRGMGSNSEKNELKIHALYSFISDECRYCPECMLEDFSQFQVVYLHRMHQFAFLKQCMVHGSELFTSCNACGTTLVDKKATWMLFDLDCPKCNQNVLNDRNSIKIQADHDLLDDINTLMSQRKLDIDTLHLKFMINIGKRNYIHFRGDYIYKRTLLSEFIKFYGELYLSQLGIFTDEILETKNITRLFDKRYMGSLTILYILLMRFLSGSVEKFLNNKDSYSTKLPFGCGPWLCLNPICQYYNELVITDIKRRVHEWATGRFTCSHCGLIYTRKAIPNGEENGGYSIETWGFLFIQKAQEYYDMGMTFREIGERLSSNRTTVQKYLRPHTGRRRKSNYPGGIKEEMVLEMGFFEAAATSVDKITLCKETVLEAIRMLGHEATRPKIRKYNIHRYDWLMKREKEWMEEHLPARKPLPKAINWETLDDEIYQELKEGIAKVYSKNPAARISGSALFRELPKEKFRRYFNNRSILPRTRDLYESNIETMDAYGLRMIDRVIEWFEQQSNYDTPSLKIIQKKFSLYKNCSKKVQDWVVAEVKKQIK